MNFIFSITKDDIELINKFLKILSEKAVITVSVMNSICNNDVEKAKFIATYIVRKEYARFCDYGNGVVRSNKYTKEVYEQRYFEKDIIKEFNRAEQEDVFKEKAILEIEKLKLEITRLQTESRFIKPAFWTGITGAIVALISLIWQIIYH